MTQPTHAKKEQAAIIAHQIVPEDSDTDTYEYDWYVARDAALAAIMECDAWQDIEGAPRDGTRIIVSKWAWVYVTLDALMAAWADDPFSDDFTKNRVWHLCFVTAAAFDVEKRYWTDGLERLVEPTHWRPLPAPPVAAAIRAEEQP